MKPNIVVLDGHAVNPGDLSWNKLANLGNLEVYERSTPEQVVHRAQNADIVLSNKALLRQEQLQELKQLKFISVLATGVNVVDVAYASQMGIITSNAVGYSTASVAQQVFALLLELTNRVGYHSLGVAENEWAVASDWSYWHYPLKELAHKTMGIIGLGNIGLKVAEIALAFDMKVITVDRGKSYPQGIVAMPLQDLLGQSHVVSLNCPLTDENHNLINRRTLVEMRPDALLINTARGPLIHESDLAAALKDDIIAGAGLDVLCDEPPPADHPLYALDNCIITPHQAWASLESRTRLLEESVKNVTAFLEGSPRNVVKS
jgi:glycerate dehydrogenase